MGFGYMGWNMESSSFMVCRKKQAEGMVRMAGNFKYSRNPSNTVHIPFPERTNMQGHEKEEIIIFILFIPESVDWL